jgi:hypothetical protein
MYCGESGAPGQPVHDPGNAHRFLQRKQRETGGAPADDPGLVVPHALARAEAANTVERFAGAVTGLKAIIPQLETAVANASDMEKAAVQVGKLEEEANAARNAAVTALSRASIADEAANQFDRELTVERVRVSELTEQVATQAAEHADHVRAMAAQQRAETDQIRREADEAVAAARTEAAERVAGAQADAVRRIEETQAEADRRVDAADLAREQANEQALVASETASAARQETAAANARADQAVAEAGRVRDGYERQVSELRADAGREREQAAAQLADARQAAARERAGFEAQLTAADDRAGQLTLDVERERLAAGERERDLRALYEGRIADHGRLLDAAERRAASAEEMLAEVRGELRRLRSGEQGQ